ncbi:MAG: toll/interleukin-1 receptor domain-containing protein [Acidimicrobiia bacterium]
MSPEREEHVSANITGNVSGQVAVGTGITQSWLGPPAVDAGSVPHADVKVFISYRRDDADGHAGRLRDWLVRRFGEQQVFLDVAGIDPGEDFADKLAANVADCDVLLAVIGRRWITVADSHGRRRLDDPQDWVALEIRMALDRDVTVVPVLVSGAKMPTAADLPERLAPLARRNAIEIGPQWGADVERLGDVIERAARPRTT